MGTSETLRSVIDAGRTTKRLDELSTARVIGKAAEQIHAAQQKAGAGKAIGPITPLNITLSADGATKLELGLTIGALGYNSPEQLADAAVDRRSDVFSLGVVMWEALTHQRLFEAMNDAAVKLAIVDREIKSPSEINANIPTELGTICMKALARNAADRYQTTKVMAAEIEAVLDDAGYADNDEAIATYLAGLAKPARITPPYISPPTSVAPPSSVAPPTSVAPPSEKLPSILRQDAATLTPGSFLTPPSSSEKPASVAPPAAAIPTASTQAMPPTTPGAALERTAPSRLAMPPAPPVLPPTTASVPATANKATLSATVPPPPEMTTVVDAPHPVAAVSLGPARSTPATPGSTGRQSEELLAGWGWGTDSHPAVTEYSDDDSDVAPPSRKPLLYVLGGGLGFAAIITIIAVGFGSPKKPDRPATVAKSSDPAMAQPPTPAEVGAAGANAGSADVAATANVPSEPQQPPAAVPPPADAQPEPVTPPDKPATPDIVRPPDRPAKPDIVKPPDKPAKPDNGKLPEKLTKPARPDKLAKPDIVKPPDKLAKPAPKPDKPVKLAKLEPAKPARPSDKPSEAKVEVETAYRIGLQQFARGDTNGALTSLRTSLAGNPSYPPTWRGLGLVYEKMGDKDQARAAYKRYLLLAPSAGDADQIRGRLERLGS